MKLNLRKLVLGAAIAILPQLMNAQDSGVAFSSHDLGHGTQNGSFTAEYTMVANADDIDAALGFCFGDATQFNDFGPIVRFTTTGVIDARNGAGYEAETVINYVSGESFLVKMDVNVLAQTYTVKVTPASTSTEVTLATDYAFRTNQPLLNKYGLKAGTDTENHTITGFTSTPVTGTPIISEIMNVKLLDTDTKDIAVTVVDPLEGAITIEGVSLPSFITLVDNGSGSATLTVNPASANFGSHDITVKATASSSSETTFNVYVANSANTHSIKSDNADATVSIGIAIEGTATNHNEFFVGNRTITHAVGGSNGIIPFVLPAKPDGTQVVDASLKLYVKGGSSYWINGYLDLYALPFRTVVTPLEADFYAGDFAATEGDNVGIQEKIIEKNVAVGKKDTDRFEQTSTAADAALVAYIEAQYTAGAVAGDVVFLRLSPNGDLSPDTSLPEGGFAGSAYWAVSTAEEADVTKQPTLTIEFSSPLSNEKVEKQALSIYPNPVVNGEFTVSTIGMKSAVEMTIFNVTGKLVSKQSLNAAGNKATVNVNLSQGLYIVQLSDGDVIKTSKMSVK